MFVSAESFDIQPYRLVNLDASDEFESYVHGCEGNRLIKILGRSLYDAFIDACFTVADGIYTPKGNDLIAQRWKDLRDGVEYTMNGRTYKWEGMIKLLKPYVFA